MAKLCNCIDAGSKYCPCNLASTMDCISCSQLRGQDFCDCHWNGVCIMYEYFMQNKESHDLRKTSTGTVVERTVLEENLFLIKIQLDKDLLKELDRIGSYIFIKNFETNCYYETPMSIFNLDGEYAYIVYQEVGPKTKNIKLGDKLTIRGPYWNGIVGEHKLSSITNSNILIIARGIGQSSILLPIKKLIDKGNKIRLILDKGKLNSLYCLDYISDERIAIENINLLSVQGKEKLKKIIEDNPIDVVLSAGAEIIHREVIPIIDESKKGIELFVTNNNILCCGEGICGSCTRKIKSGERIKTCKAMIDPKKIY